MTRECEYTVKYLPKNKINGILDCSYKISNKRISEPCFTSSIYNLYLVKLTKKKFLFHKDFQLNCYQTFNFFFILVL